MGDMMINILQHPRDLSAACHSAGNPRFPCRSTSPEQSGHAFIYFFSVWLAARPRIRKNHVRHSNFLRISGENLRFSLPRKSVCEKEIKFRRMKQMPPIKLKLEQNYLKPSIRIDLLGNVWKAASIAFESK